VDFHVDSELSDAEKYTNREPFDESGVWSLHELAARIYQRGWQDGVAIGEMRESRRRQRDKDRARPAVSGEAT
jgi:hypothetical protein